jgi:hypothetical protein
MNTPTSPPTAAELVAGTRRCAQEDAGRVTNTAHRVIDVVIDFMITLLLSETTSQDKCRAKLVS